MGDFLGFTFGGVHSSDLGITRVSGGDRYDEQLHPEIKDRTAEAPGLNGEYYFGSDFGPRSFDIEIAFDHLTEWQFRRLRKIFGTKHIQKLIFDERPYKYYMAKLESPVELSYVCFDEPNYNWRKIQTGYNTYVQGIKGDFEYKEYDGTTQRIYKGEGKMTFICYFPFAKSNFKVLPKAGNEYYEGSEEWAVSSGILSVDEYQNYDTYATDIVTLKVVNNNNEVEQVSYDGFKVYNPGDLSTGFRLYCPFITPAPSTYDLTISYVDGTDIIHSLKIEGLQKLSDKDEGFLINTNNGLIEGVSNFAYVWPGNATYETTGTLYNRFVTAGHFFKLQPDTELKSGSGNIYVLLNGNNISNPQIFYDYLYF